ncbi:MAG: hypothetical protein PUD81_06190 [Eggerthellales bacterium]|nr:hypothetical protein [Eggerthellales bacterium]
MESPSKQLLLIPTFVVDVMCIKPFDEGTGRLSRAFSLLLMEKAGFDIFRFVSIDRLCEQQAACYYDALNRLPSQIEHQLKRYSLTPKATLLRTRT